jgi:hypothetical protein
MTEEIGAWERKAEICLVDIRNDKDNFFGLLERMVGEYKSSPKYSNSCMPQIEIARNNLKYEIDDYFLCMFVWDYDNQHFIPFTSPVVKFEDVDLLHEIVIKFIEISIQCCSDGFEVITFNDNNKLLAFALQALCENQIMQIKLKHYEKQ